VRGHGAFTEGRRADNFDATHDGPAVISLVVARAITWMNNALHGMSARVRQGR
jgi:hypothetical protein